MKKLFVFLTLPFYIGASYAGDEKLRDVAEIQLGDLIFHDTNLSLNRNQACSSCHKGAGFVDQGKAVSEGSAINPETGALFTGTLNTPSVGYTAYSPDFNWDKYLKAYVGGLFWNGRAKNMVNQAQQPFLNPIEMAMPDARAVVDRLSENETYRQQFRKLYGITLPHKKPSPKVVNDVFVNMAHAIASYEQQNEEFSKFNSKFDYVLTGMTTFTPQEQLGFDLFNNPLKGNCAVCHSSDSTLDKKGRIIVPPLFTNFSYENIGAPRNLRIPGNPEPDLGLGGRPDIQKYDKQGLQIGKHKTMSLRNVAITAPYGHNGVFPSLQMIVHFYNTRDVLPHTYTASDGSVKDCTNISGNPPFPSQCWPVPEVSENLSTQFGNLGLLGNETAAIVAFMNTLTDDYPTMGNDPLVPPGTPSPYPYLRRPSK
jgi:cytochrome c peroxidase